MKMGWYSYPVTNQVKGGLLLATRYRCTQTSPALCWWVTDEWAYLNLCAWWCTGPPKRRDWPWYICDIIWEFRAWLGLAANLTVMGSALPGGVCPFRCLTASSASDLLSKRMKATPRERPGQPIRKGGELYGAPESGSGHMAARCVTWGLVHQHSGVDDVPKAGEHVFQFLLTQRPRQPADVQICIFDHVRTRPRERDLQGGDGKRFRPAPSQIE